MKKINIITIILSAIMFCGFAYGEGQSKTSGKPYPEVTFDKVEEIFGHNLDTDDTTLKTLLLAIGMDHTAPGSPHIEQQIGIPYIVHKSAEYWVSKLKTGERRIDVLVNNALLLLFTKEDIPNSKSVAFDLMKLAADKGYWPADYYIAENNLSKYLTPDYSHLTPKTGAITSENIDMARDTMMRYNRCAEMGFAPCQYRIGFWLTNSDKTIKDGLSVLRQAINTTISDNRYTTTLDRAMISASAEIVLKGDTVGIDEETRQKYAGLVRTHLAKLERDAEQMNSVEE